MQQREGPENIDEREIKKNEIKAKIANEIWKFRTRYWNDSIKI